LKARTDKAEV